MNDSHDKYLTSETDKVSNYSNIISEESRFNSYLSKEEKIFRSYCISNNIQMPDFASQKIRKNKSKRNKVIISKKPISLEALYHYSVAKPRICTVQIVENLRKHYTKKEFIYDEDRESILLQKTLKVKWLPTTYINPIKEIRFFDYIFALDSDMYKTECYDDNSHFDGSQYGFDKMYKIVMVEKELKSNMIKLFVENKEKKNTEDFINEKQIDIKYLKSWLMSMNSKQTKQIKDGIEKLQENIKKGYHPYIIDVKPNQTENCDSGCNSNLANLSTSSKDNSPRESNNNQKPEIYWINKLNLQTKNWLKDQPFIKKSYEIISSTPVLKSFEMNEHFARFIGYQSSSTFGNNEFSFMKNMISFSYSDILVTRIFQNRFEGDLNDLIQIKGVEDSKFTTAVPTLFKGGNTHYFSNYKTVFEEEYETNLSCYKNTYVVFLNIP